MKTPVTYFIRHSAGWDVADEFRDELWNEKKIAIRFEDIRSRNPDDYHSPRGQGSMRRFCKLADDGGYVCATISPHAGCIVARVRKNTPIRFERIRDRDSSSRVAIIKVIRLQGARRLSADLANRLLICQPQQGTITEWKAVGDRVRHIVQHGKLAITKLDDLLPYEQEVMCSEFLRTYAAKCAGLPLLVHLSAPVGRTRKAVDVAGVTARGTPILAQVTHLENTNEECEEKAAALRETGQGSMARLIIFCRCDSPTREDGVQFYPMDRVFQSMRSLSAWRTAIGIQK